MKCFLNFILFLFLITPAYAQDKGSNTELVQEDLKDLSRGGTGRIKSFTDIEGTPYYNKEWNVGRILLKSGAKTEPIMIRFNSYEDKVLFQKNDSVLEIMPSILRGFVFIEDEGNQIYKNGFSNPEEGIKKGHILEVIYEGKTKLLGRYTKTISEGNSPGFRTGRVTDRFVDHEKYYLVDINGTWHETDLEEGDILDSLGNYKSELTQFAESNNYDFEKKKDLGKILLHYDKINSSKSSH